jgi:hypothetical protein
VSEEGNPAAVADALKRPKFASTSWYRNQKPRKYQAGIRTGKKTTQVRILDCG